MQTLSNTSLSESQFAQIIGRCRCYQALPIGYQKSIPKLLITDSQINSVCRDFYHNEAFGMKDNAISLFDFHPEPCLFSGCANQICESQRIANSQHQCLY